MSVDSYFIGAYWRNRPEAALTIATKLKTVFNRLLELEIGPWYHQVENPNSKKRLSNPEIEGIYNVLIKDVRKGSIDKADMNKTGYGYEVWNGKEDNAESMGFGLSAGYVNPILNSCVITLPHKIDGSARFQDLQFTPKILTSIIEIWNPDWAVLQSRGLRKEVGHGNRVGWITYYRDWSIDTKYNGGMLNSQQNEISLIHPEGPLVLSNTQAVTQITRLAELIS